MNRNRIQRGDMVVLKDDKIVLVTDAAEAPETLLIVTEGYLLPEAEQRLSVIRRSDVAYMVTAAVDVDAVAIEQARLYYGAFDKAA